MTKLLFTAVGAALSLALLAPAHAGDHVSFECAGFRAEPAEAADRDPVVKTAIGFYAPRTAKTWTEFEVVHTTLNGESFSREKQYRDIRLWSNAKGEFWSGVSVKDPRRTMVGHLAFDESRGVSARRYIEKSYVSGRLERTVTSTCVWSD
jgi:hypothetical protein